jgi:hypothetical protein
MRTGRPKFHSRGSRIAAIPPGYSSCFVFAFLAPQIVQRIDLLTLGAGRIARQRQVAGI